MLRLGRASFNYLKNSTQPGSINNKTVSSFHPFNQFIGCKYSTISSIKRGSNDSSESATKLSEEELNKKKRRERSANANIPPAGTPTNNNKKEPTKESLNSSNSTSYLGWLLRLGAAIAAAYGAYENRDYFTSSFNKLSEPSSDKLVPDFVAGPFYGLDLPAGTPPPILLVLDLERTLIGSDYDSKHGWRHVKRPGLDRFIDQLKQYYEIVLFSENDRGMTMEIMEAIGKGQTHMLGSSEAEVHGDQVIKRLDLMNRPIERIILIDDDPVAFQKFPRNTLQIKPFLNINDTSDVALLELIPLLQAIVHEGANDIRETFDDLGTHDAHEASMEYKMRVARARGADYKLRRRGIGAFIHPSPHAASPDKSETNNIPTAMDIVGKAPIEGTVLGGGVDKKTGKSKEPTEKKKGAFFSWLEEREKEKSEVENNKLEKMNEMQQKKMMDLQKEEQIKRLLEEDRLFKQQLEKERRDAKL